MKRTIACIPGDIYEANVLQNQVLILLASNNLLSYVRVFVGDGRDLLLLRIMTNFSLRSNKL